MIELDKINPIGIGTYNLNLKEKTNTLKALLHSVNKGQNFMSTSLLYDNCNVVNFLYEFFKQVEKDNIFLTCHLEPYIEKREDIEKLNKFQDERFNNIEIDWKNQGGITIDKLASQFKID